MRRAILAACIASSLGCGRLSFDPTRDGGEAVSGDGEPDGPAEACAGYALCEGFEDVALAPRWSTMGGVARDTTVFNRGVASMRFAIPTLGPNIGARSIIAQQMTFAATPNAIHVRAYVRFGGLPATNNQFPVLSVSELTSSFENSLYVRATSLAVYNQWSDTTNDNLMTPPTNTWLCLLWSTTRSTTATGSVELVGDVSPASLTNVITDGPVLQQMALGINFYAAGQPTSQPALQVWMDDILIDDAPLTCAE